MTSSSGLRILVVASLSLLAGSAAMAATESVKTGPPIVAAAETSSPKRDTDRQAVGSAPVGAGVEIEPLTLVFAGLGVGVLLLLRRIER